MGLLFPIIKTTTVLLVMTPEFIRFYVVITGYITYRIFPGLYLFLLKNPKVPVLILNPRRQMNSLLLSLSLFACDAIFAFE